MKHDVNFSIPERKLGNADIEFKVKRGGQKFGALRVSKGSLVWVPKDSTYGYKIGWSPLGEVIKANGTHENQ